MYILNISNEKKKEHMHDIESSYNKLYIKIAEINFLKIFPFITEGGSKMQGLFTANPK